MDEIDKLLAAILSDATKDEKRNIFLDNLQKEHDAMQKFINVLDKQAKKKKRNISYDSMTTIYLLYRITQLEEKLNKK